MRFRSFIIFLSALFASAFARVRCVNDTDVFNHVNVETMGSSQSMPLGNVLGDGPVFLIVWANFCAPCVRKIPSIPLLQAALRFRGLKTRVVMVSIDEQKEKVNCYLNQVLQLWSHNLSSAIAQVGSNSIPCAFLLDNKGKYIRKIKKLVPEKDRWDCEDVVSQIQYFEQHGAE